MGLFERCSRNAFRPYLRQETKNEYPFSFSISKFDNHETDSTAVEDIFETGYQNYKFADIDTDFVLRPEVGRPFYGGLGGG